MEHSELQTWLEENANFQGEYIPQDLISTIQLLKEKLEKTEEKLQKVQEELDFIKASADAMPNPIFMKDEELKFVFFNQAYRKFFGVKDNEYIGKKVEDLSYLSERERARYHKEDAYVVDTLSVLKYETKFITAAQEQTQSLYWTKGFEVPNNGSRGLIGEIVDISKEKKTQLELNKKIQELKEQKQLFTLLVNGTSDIFIMFSAKDYKVEYISPNIELLLGLSIEEVKKDIRKISDTAIGLEQDEIVKQLESIPLGGCIQILNEHIHQRNGERRWYQKNVYRFFLNNADKYIVVMSERTTEMETQNRLKIAMEMAQSANVAKSKFLANMSHDIRTPMNAIIGFSNLLKHDAKNPEKVKGYAGKINSAGQQLLRLINDILDMSKIESGKTTLNISEFHLSELLEDIAIVVNPQVKAKKQTFEIRTQGVQVERVMVDRTRINQILLNLLSNSVKYTPEGGKIELVISQKDRSKGNLANLRFQVIDNGMGMSPEYLEVIFDAFTREESSVLKGIQGTGLGMAITKSLVELMGGSISVESEKDKGTTFTIDLIIQNAQNDHDEDFWKKNQITKILVVDNDENICLDIKEAMSKTGVEILYTTNSVDVIPLIKEAQQEQMPYDIVLMAWKLSEMTGADTARSIREEFSSQEPKIVAIACDWSESEDEAAEAGVDALMTKPFFMTNLRSVVQYLRNQGGEQENIGNTQDNPLFGLHILAAEDNELNAEILKELMELEGVTCEIAENGKQAVEMLQASPAGYYDLILMDVQMPIMDGYTATREIRLCNHPDAKTIPIAAMTANAFDEDVVRALNSGMNAHVSKPVDMNLLKETVKQLMQQVTEK